MSTQKKNPSLLFYISAVAFFCLEIHGSVWYIVGIPLALVALFFLCKKINVAEELRCAAGMRVFCLLSALGTCIFGARNFHFLHILSVPSSRLRALVAAHEMLRPYTVTSIVAAILGAAVGLYFAYAVCVFVCKRLLAFITDFFHRQGISRAEKITYGVLFAVSAILITTFYLNSDAFFPSPKNVNGDIFSADCSLLIVSNNAFLSLSHGENDIRQPLFSVFASPFGAIPYLVSLAVPFRWSLPLFTALANLVLLLFSTLILARLLWLSSRERIIFAIVSSLTFSHIAFSLFIEQYIVAVLYLFMLLYAYCEHRRLDTFALYAATGTLTTSCVAALFMAEPSPRKNPAAWIKRLLLLALGFVVLVVAFCRAEVFNFKDAVNLMRFTGAKTFVPFSLRLLQFLESVPYYFVSPVANTVFFADKFDTYGNVTPAYYAYVTADVTGISVPGIVILVLCGVSAFLNRRNVLARFSAFWIAFCFLLTCVVGWGCGTAENSLFLYALYFGWAYFVLLFMLVQNVAEVFRAKWLVSAVSAVACVVLLWLNIPGVKSMIDFALTYYPL